MEEDKKDLLPVLLRIDFWQRLSIKVLLKDISKKKSHQNLAESFENRMQFDR